MAIQIVKSVLAQEVQDGWKLKALAEKYELPVSQMKQALRQANLTIRKFHNPKFELVDDTVVEDVNDTMNTPVLETETVATVTSPNESVTVSVQETVETAPASEQNNW